MVHEVLPTPRVRLRTTTVNGCAEGVLIVAPQIRHTFLANSLDQDSAKLGKLAPSRIRLMSQLPIRLVNILPRYEESNYRYSRPCADFSVRVIANLERNAHWHISFQMGEGLIDRTDQWEGSSISAAG